MDIFRCKPVSVEQQNKDKCNKMKLIIKLYDASIKLGEPFI